MPFIYKLKRVIIKMIPPFLFSLILNIRNYYSKKESPYQESQAESKLFLEDVYYLSSNEIINIELKKLKYFGGISFVQNQHHFIKYYEDRKSLDSFYSNHCPKSIFASHYINGHKDDKKKLPWLNQNYSDAKGEYGLSLNHGIQSYGPVTKQKLKLEKKRLDLSLKSIQSNGYLISKELPKGYFLVSESKEWVFLVVSGKHRVAALAHLNWKILPVILEPGLPRIINEVDINNWPGVKQGVFSQDEARMIFLTYFRSPDQQIN